MSCESESLRLILGAIERKKIVVTGNKALLGSIIIGCFIVFGAGWLVDTISGT